MDTQKGAPNKQERPPRLFAYSYGLIFQTSVRRILRAFGWGVRTGLPMRSGDVVAVWGRKKSARRGAWIAEKLGKPVLTIEDGFLRSIKTGRQGEPSLSLIADRTGIYFDTSAVSDLKRLIKASNAAPADEMEAAKIGMEQLSRWHLSKYNAHRVSPQGLPERFVLVIDQTKNDASITFGSADEGSFETMLRAALLENPETPVIVKTHPETVAGKRAGHFSRDLEMGRLQFLDQPISPYSLFERAEAVYCVTSQMGMEAIFAGHRPIVFGRPFYAGWDLSDDRHPDAELIGKRLPEHLFWAAYIRYTRWYDPFFTRPSDFFRTAQILHARARLWRLAERPIVTLGMRLWKRGFLRHWFRGSLGKLRFAPTDTAAHAIAKETGGSVAVWANKETPYLTEACARDDIPLYRVEDGFIRSSGLGAALVRPVSLVFDDLGIYYDPERESRLEDLIRRSENLPQDALARAASLRARLIDLRLSKYNLTGKEIEFAAKPNQKIILIPGQVEDDASILTGTTEVRTNMGLIWSVRQSFPDAYLIYKPHPDVEAGLRAGAVGKDVANGVVDKIAQKADIIDLIEKSDAVATMTSLTGFEALLRGKQVICYGRPFYAGWGFTEDMDGAPKRRRGVQVSLDGLAHAALIDYPMYWDPVTGIACPPELILDRFEHGQTGRRFGPFTRPLSKLQGIFATYAPLWR